MERDPKRINPRLAAEAWPAHFPPMPPRIELAQPDDFVPDRPVAAATPQVDLSQTVSLDRSTPPPPGRAGGMQPTLPGVAPQPEKDPRVTVRGRVATAPDLRKTQKGQPVLLFRLAEHPDDETTVYRRVRLFGKTIDRFREVLQTGAEVEVIGYEHEYYVAGRDGTPVRSTIINAVAVRT